MCLELEFIPEGFHRSPLLIMSPSKPENVKKLSQALAILVSDDNAVVDVHALPFISPVDGCRLSAQVIDEDIGAVLIENTKNHFKWQLTSQAWEFVLVLLDTMTEPDCSGYQYLGPDHETGDMNVILSTYNRAW